MNTPVNFEIAKLLKEKGFDNVKDDSRFYSIPPRTTEHLLLIDKNRIKNYIMKKRNY